MEENNCHYVCSRGILKSCNFHSPNPKSSCHNDYQYLIDMLQSNKMFNGMSIYVCSDLLHFFVNKILPKITKTFILVTGDSDLCVPREALSREETFALLNYTYLLKWFIQNTQVQDNPKIVQLPIGLDYHTIYENPGCNLKLFEESHLPKDQENVLLNIVNPSSSSSSNFKPFYERIPKIYVNFSISSDRFRQRRSSLDTIPKELLVINQVSTPRTITWQNTINYTFVLSPAGVGLDCYRTWEALCLGCIPIVCIPNFKQLFEDLPVLIVDNWSQITVELLQNTIEQFREKVFNYDKLTLSYWTNRIKNGI
jgi:hypothetical protein